MCVCRREAIPSQASLPQRSHVCMPPRGNTITSIAAAAGSYVFVFDDGLHLGTSPLWQAVWSAFTGKVVDCNGDTPGGQGHARLSYIHRGYDAPQGYVGCVSGLCCVGVCLCPSNRASAALSHPIARALAMVLLRMSARAIQRLCVCVCACIACWIRPSRVYPYLLHSFATHCTQ